LSIGIKCDPHYDNKYIFFYLFETGLFISLCIRVVTGLSNLLRLKVKVEYKIWTSVRKPIILISIWMEMYLIGLENVVEGVDGQQTC